MSVPRLLDKSTIHISESRRHVYRVMPIPSDGSYRLMLLLEDVDPDDGEVLVWRHPDGSIRLLGDPSSVGWVKGAEWDWLGEPRPYSSYAEAMDAAADLMREMEVGL